MTRVGEGVKRNFEHVQYRAAAHGAAQWCWYTVAFRFLSWAIPLLMLSAGLAQGQQRTRRPLPKLPLKKRIDLLLSTKEAATARWGILVFDPKSGKVVYERNADDHFTPASNTKLFSSALAIERLGAGYRFETKVRAERGPNESGVLHGDLFLVGGGDPTLSGREYPYRKESDGGDPLEPIADLADQIVKAGVRRIEGDIVGDDRLYVHEPYPEGWTVNDSVWQYGAPVTALPFNDGAFAVTVTPGEQAGDPALIAINPPVLPLVIDNRVVTVEGGETKIEVDRSAGSRQLRLTGTVTLGSRAKRERPAVDDSALYAAAALHDVLTRKGVVIRGQPVSLHRHAVEEPVEESGVQLARRQSPPLIEIARTLNKVSQNLHAELLLRETARVRKQRPTRLAGLEEMTEFLTSIGVPEEAYHFEDGSGLSRRNLVSPRAVVRLLEYMDSTTHRQEWEALLPIGAEDGSLEERFEKSAEAHAIHAKTGTLATVNALSGYATTEQGRRLIFSILANNFTAPPREIRRVIDRIGLALIAWEGK